MKERALDYLVCPETYQPLRLEVFQREGAEIIDGLLRSSNGPVYPIVGGVPRMLPEHLRQHLRSDYPGFFARYGAQLRTLSDTEQSRVQRHTQEAFGYEWTWAAKYDADNFADWLPEGFTAEQLFSGRVGLEVGCGAGRHAERNSRFAQIHFALDLSRAVDSAFARNRNLENCHIVQADAFSLPFRPGSFDYTYCLGVLQHMHEPPSGFRELAKQPKPGGILLVNVYQASRPIMVGMLELFRKVSTRLSNENLRRISVLAGYFEYGSLIGPWKFLKGTPFGRILRPLVPTRIDEYAKHDLQTAIVDWFDRLSCPVKIHYHREDLMRWYAECGYEDIVVTPYWKAFWNGYGMRKRSREFSNE
jgi:SAM-dependent methyltransferase/uncharacterized protein YbaR (Trm112 family)